MKKIIFGVLLGLSAQVAFAEVQVKGPVAFVAAGNQSAFLPTSTNEQAVSINTSDAGYVDWNDSGNEYTTQCGVYPIGNAAVIDITSDAGKQAMALAASANATRQEVILLYHVVSDAGWQSGFKCVVDSVLVIGG